MTKADVTPRKRGTKVQAKAEPEPKAKPTKAKPKSKPKTKPKPKTKAKPKSKPKGKPKGKPKSKGTSKPKRKKPLPEKVKVQGDDKRGKAAMKATVWFGKDEDVINAFAKNLIDARVKAGLTQQQLADAMGYSRIALSNMERAKNGATLTTLLRLCAILSTDPNTLLSERW